MKLHSILYKTVRIVSLLLALCLLAEMTTAQTPAKKRVVKKPAVKSTTLTLQPKVKKFISNGNMEVGGYFTFVSTTPVVGGTTGPSSSTVGIAPFFGYFVTDGFQLALAPEITIASFSNTSVTEFATFFAPAYYFDIEDIWYPYVQGMIGFNSVSKPAASGVSYGGQVGAKISVGGNGLVNAGIQYLMITSNKSGASTRSGRNDLTASIGLSLWF